MGSRRMLSVLCALAIAVGATMFATPMAASSPSEDPGPGCRFVEIPVPHSVLDGQIVPVPGAGTVADLLDGTGPLTVHGRLCLPAGGAPKTVMLAMHGILYNNGYWNVEHQPDTYNFARYMTRAGYAVLSIDRLGYGRSSKPPAPLVTLDSQAEMAHRIIGKLRAGDIAGHRFGHVILAGYSYGSATSWRETSKYNDADAVLTTAWGSTMQLGTLARILPTFQPAQLESRFRDRPAGYLSSPTGRDQNYFYDLSNVDPEIVEYSNKNLADTISIGEIATFFPRFGGIPITNLPLSSEEIELPLSTQTKSISVPTFLINGTGELWFCGIDQQHCTSSQELQRQESRYFSDKSCFRAAVIPNAGHNLNLQRNARFSFETMRTFADQAVGPNGENKASYRARCAAFSGSNVDNGPGRFGAVGG